MRSEFSLYHCEKSSPFCHCEERSDEAISAELLRVEIATHLSGARNDRKWKACDDEECLINQATTKMLRQGFQNVEIERKITIKQPVDEDGVVAG